MATFKVNGRTVQTEKNQKLLRFLRDELHLTSVKDGCSEGACGACTVIIDGKTCKACVPDTDLLEGREVITVEEMCIRDRGKGFDTLECYTGLVRAAIPEGSTVLLECMSNLVANEMFQKNGAHENTVEAVIGLSLIHI